MKNIFRSHSRDLVITIHGFGRKLSDEMKPLADYLEKQGFEVWRFSYFDPDDQDDTDCKAWIARCEDKIRQAIAHKRKIHLLGFSMGGVVASYLASIYPVTDLFLAAPAFYPFDFSKIEQAARSRLTSSSGSSLSKAHTKAFIQTILGYRYSILQVDCPILMVHGTSDEMVSAASSRKIYEQLTTPDKALILLEGARHRFLYDGPYQSLAFCLVRDYFRNEIVPATYHD